MFVWRKSADPRWLNTNEQRLELKANGQLVVIARSDRKRVELEVCCNTAKQARRLLHEFGGKIDKLSRDWLERFSRPQETKPIKIGTRLMILRSPEKREAHSLPYSLVIPESAAFGTGEHVTTAMALRLLEEISRKLKPGWSLVDLGTGSGILALAAKRFGAKRVSAIDNDRRAIATARENARVNNIDNIDFRVGDVRRWKIVARLVLSKVERIDIITANLFSELLIEILPKLRVARQLILSGLLREQEGEVCRALRANKVDITEVRRRGKWIAILATCRNSNR